MNVLQMPSSIGERARLRWRSSRPRLVLTPDEQAYAQFCVQVRKLGIEPAEFSVWAQTTAKISNTSGLVEIKKGYRF